MKLIQGNCLEILPTFPDQSIAAVVCDPPYPEIQRDYGRLTEEEWFSLMRAVVSEVRRCLRPSGSAVFILQPNSEHVGRLRGWLFEFQAWLCREWNLVQDVWWHVPCPVPTVHCQRRYGLLRGSVKACVWAGSPDCYRNQDAVLLPLSEATLKDRRVTQTDLGYSPSGLSMRNSRCLSTAIERGGSTPINLLTMANSQPHREGCGGHGASTPLKLCEWWVKYLTKPGDTVLDPFCGSGSVGVACQNLKREFLGIEKEESYLRIAAQRLNK